MACLKLRYMSIEDKQNVLLNNTLTRTRRSTAVETYQIQIKHSSTNAGKIDLFLKYSIRCS